MPMPDDELRTQVADELDWDPKVDSSAVAVSAHDGVVTLRGTVGSAIERSEAIRDAQRVQGVTRVEDELVVALLDEHCRDDAEVRGDVITALALNALVPSTIDATVDGGWVTLTGTASSQFQRGEADHVTARIRGVCGVTDSVRVVPFGPSAADVAAEITTALRRRARLDASNITVRSASGTVTLDGTVPSWAEHDDAVIAAWNAPGVVNVVDGIRVRQPVGDAVT